MHRFHALAAGQYNEALSLFNEAVRLCTQDQLPALHSNRSACLLQLAQPQAALSAALLVTALRPAWPKGHLRRALALSALKRFQEASTAVAQGLQLAPGDADLLEMQQTLAELQPGVRAGSSAVDAQQSHAGDSAPSVSGCMLSVDALDRLQDAHHCTTAHVSCAPVRTLDA